MGIVDVQNRSPKTRFAREARKVEQNYPVHFLPLGGGRSPRSLGESGGRSFWIQNADPTGAGQGQVDGAALGGRVERAGVKGIPTDQNPEATESGE